MKGGVKSLRERKGGRCAVVDMRVARGKTVREGDEQ